MNWRRAGVMITAGRLLAAPGELTEPGRPAQGSLHRGLPSDAGAALSRNRISKPLEVHVEIIRQ
jgi:hypothetical protein